MLELLVIAVVFWLGYQLGTAVMSWKVKDMIVEQARKEGIHVDENYNIIKPKDTKPKLCKLWVEKIQDILYLYDLDDTFICQANSLEELAKLALKYKNIKYASVINGDDVFAFVDGKVKNSKEILG